MSTLREPRGRRAALVRRLGAGLLAAGLFAASGATAVAETQAGGASPSSAEPPSTGFELSDGAAWTTEDEEIAFLAEVADRGRGIEIEQAGTSVQGRPLNLVRIGGPRLAPARTTALLLCSQHGNEPSGREACLSTIRDLAFTEDRELQRLLRTTELLFVPTANPDGFVANTRGNGEGIDINRDHIALTTPEARTIAELLRDHEPDLVYDLHEYGARPPVYDRDFLSLWPRNLNTDDRVHAQSEALSEEYVRPAVETAGFTSGIYGIHVDPETGEPIEQVAGDGQERILRNTAGIKDAVGILVETRTTALTEEELADPAVNNRRRVDSQLAGLAGAFDMLRERGARISLTTGAARAAGYLNHRPIYFGGADNEEPAPDDVVTERICGYRLTAEQFTEVESTLATHGVRSWSGRDGVLVPMAQPLRELIPLLLDERADFHLTAGTPAARC
ncbi:MULTISPECIES: M14 family metallocarboxypeptidase [Actinoalloteichus]|uniref:Zinc carboxypeptidase n=1 Tax=Actinoalloteichus fjordicus TaxID=1612552 RepID=A0AAC9LFP7_9PSEU|nr:MULTISPECIES: M14 family metallocarboxypeptidase [Actinoalloteichus]APU17088.1 Zinc carboxypeptidase [Actinoalloteichus fjordicus]APU23169.1 Zinc carboxypeptidase [Actinoalloteichus sp. GBA129-24]